VCATERGPRAELATKQGQTLLAAGRNAFKFARRLAALGRPTLAHYLAEQTAACSYADAIVFSRWGSSATTWPSSAASPAS
jgi:hypothetical protein